MPEDGEIKILGTHTALVRDPNRDMLTSGRNSICIMECPKDSAEVPAFIYPAGIEVHT